MTQTRETILSALGAISLPDGGDLVSRDMVRAVQVQGGKVSFILEAPTPEAAQTMGPVRDAAEALVAKLDGVEAVTVALTAHGPAKAAAPTAASTAAATAATPGQISATTPACQKASKARSALP